MGPMRRKAGQGEHLCAVNLTARTKDLAADGALRRGEPLCEFLARAVRETHFRDLRQQIRDRIEEERLAAGGE